jgi:dTDP-4-amino-4,6-dideoxygalactose transaminase
MTKPPTIPVVRPVLPSFNHISEDLERILASGILTKGIHLREFEEAAAQYLNVKHVVAVSSCTSGLMLAYRALNLQDEAIVPSFTFMASVSALVWAGVTPVFAETDFQTRNINPETVEELITPRTSAIVGVHNFGNAAPIAELMQIAERHHLTLIFDAAHAFGSTYQGGSIAAQGDAQVFSLSPTKTVIAGEGGIVTTNNSELADELRRAREYGNDGTYNSAFAGLNARLPEISALLANASLRSLDLAIENRNNYADFYRNELGRLPGIEFQKIAEGNRSAYKDFCISVDESEFGLSRDELAQALAEEGIETRSYYNPPVHLQTAYRQCTTAHLPVTEKLAQENLSLPMWSLMDTETLERVCSVIARIQSDAAEIKWRTGEATRTNWAHSRPANKNNANENAIPS